VTDPKTLSILAGTWVIVFAAWQWRRIFSLTCTGVFFLSHLIFVGVGILAFPWLLASGYMEDSYSMVRFGLINAAGVSETIILFTAGLIAVFLGNASCDTIFFRAAGRPTGAGIQLWEDGSAGPQAGLGILGVKLKWLFTLLLFLALTRLAPFWREVLEGLRETFVVVEHGAFYKSRAEIKHAGYLYFMLAYNALPFLSVIFWMLHRKVRTPGNRAWALFMAASTALLMVFTFTKRPLLVYLLTLFAADLLMRLPGRVSPGAAGGASVVTLISAFWKRVSLALLAVFSLTFTFFYLLAPARGNILRVAGLTLDRIFTRLAVMPIFYVHFFPDVAPHYGIKNIGALSHLMGVARYADNVAVYNYFISAGGKKGSAAIGALFDFYGAFGWVGFLLCCLLLGALLRALDAWISSLSPGSLNKALSLFMMLFSYTLSQASFFRSLSSFGGLTFIALWALLQAPWPLAARPAQALGGKGG
jgi:hypothetical protein